MKKTFVVFLVIALVLCLPCNHSLAFSKSDFVLHTRDSVSGFASGTYQEYLDAVYIPSFSLDFYDLINRLPSDDPIFSFDHYIVFGTNNSLGIFGFNSPDNSNVGMLYCDWYPDSNYGSDGYYIKVPSNANISNYACYMFNNNAQVWTPNTSAFSVFQEGGNFFYIASQYKYYVFDTDLFITVDKQGTIIQLFPNGYQNLDNMNPEGLPYEDSNGNIVSPVEYESNENHMYLKSCDVGFCKPYSLNDLSSAGGGYLYVKYSFDNWVNSHSSDYWVNIRTVVNVDGTQYSGINTRALDLNGVNVLTFAESTVPNGWGDEGLLFVEFPDNLVSTYKTGYVYNMPYLTFADTDSNGVSNRSRFLGNGRNRLFLTPSGGRGVNITDSPIGQALQDIFQVNVHQSFTITVTVWLQDTDNNRSGDFTKTFNLVTGVSSTTDTSITDNDNPFEPDPSLPDIPDGSGDDSYSLAPIVNNFTINGSGTIGYDPGYRDLKEDVDKDPDGNFTQYLDPMHNDEVGSWFMSFVNAMPSEMKAILITGAGVGVFFGLYRFVRRG